jgi:hypothetical protein
MPDLLQVNSAEREVMHLRFLDMEPAVGPQLSLHKPGQHRL